MELIYLYVKNVANNQEYFLMVTTFLIVFFVAIFMFIINWAATGSIETAYFTTEQFIVNAVEFVTSIIEKL